MAKALLPDELWSLIAAHLPVHPPSPKGGRPRISDRAGLTGILFVLRTGIPWEYLPRELGIKQVVCRSKESASQLHTIGLPTNQMKQSRRRLVDSLTELFCLIDDFCQCFEPE
jgi:transposase